MSRVIYHIALTFNVPFLFDGSCLWRQSLLPSAGQQLTVLLSEHFSEEFLLLMLCGWRLS